MKHLVVLTAVMLGACAQPGYMYDTGSFVQHPRPEFCASRGQVLDTTTLQCVTPPPPQPPTPLQIVQTQKAQAVTHERNACVNDATVKFKRGVEGQLGSYAIWRAELKHCDDLMISRLVAQQMKGADCSLKLDWILRYRMMVTSLGQREMAEDRYAEYCPTR